MQFIEVTINHLTRRPGQHGTGGVCLPVSTRLTSMTVFMVVNDLDIANAQFKSYESDLGMT